MAELKVVTNTAPQPSLKVVTSPAPKALPIYKAPAQQPVIPIAKPAPPQNLQVNNTPAPHPEIQVDNSARFVKLGDTVKAKFPGTYDSIESGQLGKIVAIKYPTLYDSLIDPAFVDPEPQGKPKQDSSLRQFLSPLIGGVKEVGSIANNISGFGQKVLNKIDPFSDGSVAQINPNLLKSKNAGESIGKGITDIASFFLPGGAVEAAGKAAETGIEALNLGSKTAKALNLGARAGAEAASTFGVSKAEGQSNKDAAINSVIGGLSPIASEVLAPLKESAAGRFINSLIKPKEADFRFGKNPGLAVAEEGITGNTLKGLQNNISRARKAVGQSIDTLLTHPAVAGIKQDITAAFTPIDEAISKAVDNGEQDLVTRLLSLKNGLTKDYKLVDGALKETGAKDLVLTPKEIQQMKIKVGEGTRWTGQAFDSDINQVKTKVYRELNNLVEKAAPGTKELQAKYANLLTAEKAAEKRAGVATRNNLVSLPNVIEGGLGTLLGTVASGGVGIPALATGVAGIGLSKAAGSTAFKSRVAKQLAKPAGKGLGLISKTYFGTRPKN
jgi:hypothetical protein